MKKFLAFVLLLLMASSAFAGSVDTVRGLVYLPTKQTTGSIASVEVTAWTDTTYLGPYINRVFVVKNTSPVAETINATPEASMDLTTWVTQDATSLLGIAQNGVKSVKITDNPMPYWRIRAISGFDGVYHGVATVEVSTSMCTQ